LERNEQPRTAATIKNSEPEKVRMEVLPEGWIMNDQTSFSGKSRPEESLFIKKTRVSITFANILKLKKDFVAVPFKDDNLSMYPGCKFVSIEDHIPSIVERKKDKWNKEDPQPFNCKTINLNENFRGFILFKLEDVKKSIEKVINLWESTTLI
jgi:hypothetical protein